VTINNDYQRTIRTHASSSETHANSSNLKRQVFLPVTGKFL